MLIVKPSPYAAPEAPAGMLVCPEDWCDPISGSVVLVCLTVFRQVGSRWLRERDVFAASIDDALEIWANWIAGVDERTTWTYH